MNPGASFDGTGSLPSARANAIVAYVAPILVKTLILQQWTWPGDSSSTLEQGFQQTCVEAMGPYFGAWLYTASYLGLWWLVLFVLFTILLSRRGDARLLYRALFRGVAWAAVLAVVLGLLDFFGTVSLAGYNLSHLFYGARYRRLQPTFGNPSWFACFVCCALPFVLLEFWEARKAARGALAAFAPLCVASLFLSGARAAWLACLVLAACLIVLQTVLRRRGSPLPSLGPAARIAAAVTVAGSLLAAAVVYFPATPPSPASSTARLPGLARELRIRGAGVNSPRAVTARYALALARQAQQIALQIAVPLSMLVLALALVALVLFSAGCGGMAWCFIKWWGAFFGTFESPMATRLMVLSITLLAAGTQIFLTAFLSAIMDVGKDPVSR